MTDRIEIDHEGVRAVWKGGGYADVLMVTATSNGAMKCVDVLDTGMDAGSLAGTTPTPDTLAEDLASWVSANYATYWNNG